MFTELHGADHLRVGRVVNNLGYFWKKRDEPEKAEPYFRRALGIFRQSFKEPHHPIVGVGASNLAGVLNATGRFEEAEPLLLETYPIIAQEKRGMFYPVEALNRLVRLYEAWGKEAEAARYRALLAEARP